MKRTILIVNFFLLFVFQLFSQNKINVEPEFWWIGMRNTKLQLIVNAKNIAICKPELNYKGVEISNFQTSDNPNYLFVDLIIHQEAKSGKFPISFKQNNKLVYTFEYELKSRTNNSLHRQNITNKDVIYLLMPDRFVNGNPANDNTPETYEKVNRSNFGGRHGGDIAGMLKSLDYIKDLGATTIWPTPLIENNMKEYSYHGYASTNYYKIDSRFGSNDEYLKFIETAHQKGLKIIQDMIFNHCGSEHIWMKDMPDKNWFHNFASWGQTNFKGQTITDSHVSQYDYNKMEKGWFVETMPDLNQSNPLVASYFIQNTIWWLEYSGIDGIRVDTYPYPDKYFMSRWAKAIQDEYPGLFIVGEIWLNKPSMVAYYQDKQTNHDGYQGYLPNVFDFPLESAFENCFENSAKADDIFKLYDIICEDFVYPNPDNLVTFVDNHDVDRYFSRVKENIGNMKLAFAMLLTTRGIPLVYYGSEFLFTNQSVEGDGGRRKDFPGGWENDKANAFTKTGFTPQQIEFSDLIKKILEFRKNSQVLQSGKLTHFVPYNGVYSYFRHNEKETVMIILNNSESVQSIDKKRYDEFFNKYTKGIDVISGKILNLNEEINVPAKSFLILNLK